MLFLLLLINYQLIWVNYFFLCAFEFVYFLFAFLFNFCLILQDRAWGDHWDEAIGESRELNPHIPKPDPPKEEEKVEEKKEEAEEKKSDDKKEEDKEKVILFNYLFTILMCFGECITYLIFLQKKKV